MDKKLKIGIIGCGGIANGKHMPALKNLSNPYDDTLRTAEGVETKWDYAYYNGKYYVYFGALPWRGMHKHVVDRIVSVKNVSSTY